MLTPRQHEALNVICVAVASGKPAPSYQQIGRQIGATSRGFVHSLVHGLKERGFLACTYGKHRSLRPLKWPDGRDFDPNQQALVLNVIAAYEDGRVAGLLGSPAEPVPLTGQHGVAWALGHKAGTKERAPK